MSSSAASNRRSPVQGRSNETVNAILDAAAALLERIPVNEITTSRIAAEAQVSVGGLYRFFADKQEIFDAIAVRGLEAFRLELGPLLNPARLLLQRAHPLDAVLDAYVDFLQRHPGFRTLALKRLISDKTRADQVHPDQGPASILKDHLVAHFHFQAGEALDLKLRIAAEIGDHLIAYAFSRPTAAQRNAVIAELKKLLRGYIA